MAKYRWKTWVKNQFNKSHNGPTNRVLNDFLAGHQKHSQFVDRWGPMCANIESYDIMHGASVAEFPQS